MFSAPGYHATRRWTKNEKARFGEGDVLVLFGELFNRGYANGLVDEAQARGLKIIYATVGRRDKETGLRKFNAEELAAQPKNLINVPLEAGFDMEPASDGLTPLDRVKDLKLSDWESASIPEKFMTESRERGRTRFTTNVREFVRELKPMLPKGRNVLFAHLMAGGVPRTKIIMPLMNRSLKGTGERFLSSEKLWNTDLGRLCNENFKEVTAHTFDILIQETTAIRKELEAQGAFCAYTAYGYHGTEVANGPDYNWQTYTPYLQGWAKMALEDFSRQWSKQGVRTCVYNCPEILTNSSSIFQGVEIPLYPLLTALKKEGAQSAKTKTVWSDCAKLLKPGITLEQILATCQTVMQKPEVRSHCVYEKWPQHNEIQQLQTVLNASQELVDAHLDPKQLMTTVLSEVVFPACGKLMLEDAAFPQSPVTWLNHDAVAHTHLLT